MLTNVLSFDVKVWDPGTEVRIDNSDPNLKRPLVPSDPGYATTSAISSTPPQFGAYVDLNYTSTKITGSVNDGVLINNSAKFASLIPPAPPTYFAGPYYGGGQKSGLAAAKATGNFATFALGRKVMSITTQPCLRLNTINRITALTTTTTAS